MSRCWSGLITVLALALFAPAAEATAFFAGSNGTGLSASASFTISGAPGARQLTILLTNTDSASGSGAPSAPADVLTGVFFNLGTATFTPVSAELYTNASILNPADCDAGSNCGTTKNVGGEFSYASGGIPSKMPGTTQGISSSGYLNGNTSTGNFNGPDLDDPDALNGINFGIVPDGWSTASGGPKLNKEPLIEGTVKFVLTIPDGLTEADIKNVYFTYGTDLKEPRFGGQTTSGSASTTTTSTTSTSGVGSTGSIPEPASLTLLGIAGIGLAQRLRTRHRRQ